jgi:hypothetical protein
LLQTWNRSFPDLEDWDELKIGNTLNARRNAEIRAALDQIQRQWSNRFETKTEQSELDMLEVRGIKPRLSVGGEEDFADMMGSSGFSSGGHPTLVAISSGQNRFGASGGSQMASSAGGGSVTSPTVSVASLEDTSPSQAAGEDEWDL